MKVLYAEDELNYRNLVKMFLQSEGYDVILAKNGEEAIELFYDNDIGLVILDVMMPNMNGWETCSEIRKISIVPIIMLTALGDIENEVYGLDHGADEYISKPFSKEQLITRVKAILRRQTINEREVIKDDAIKMIENELQIRINNKEVELTLKEHKLLKLLMVNKGRTLKREHLLDEIWGFDYYKDPRTLDTHVKSLRAKLKEKGSNIQTVRGIGYCYRGDSE